MSLAYKASVALQAFRLRRNGIAKHMRVFSHTTVSERLALHSLARSLPDKAQVLEIGSHIGSSALLIGAALAPKNGHLYCVDTWQNETMPDGDVDTYAKFDANTKEFASIITKLRKRSETLVFNDIGTKLDMAFIDGDHSEQGVCTDLNLVKDWVKPGGYIAFHDANPVFPGVHKAIGLAIVSGNWQLSQMTGSLVTIVKSS